MNAIELQHLSAAYRASDVLRAVTLAAAEGEWLALLGPNGAGKSTLLRVITGLLPAREGAVLLGGRDIRTIGGAERARLIAVVPQEISTPLPFSVGELVTLGRSSAHGRLARLGAADRRAIVKTVVGWAAEGLQVILLNNMDAPDKVPAGFTGYAVADGISRRIG